MCDVCWQVPCDPRCPNAPEPEHIYECELCDSGITYGEEFVEIEGKYYHKDCLSVDDLLEALDIDVHVAIGGEW